MEELLFMRPYMREMIWGGEKLKQMYGYETQSDHIGEAWLVSAHQDGQSTVDGGTYDGLTLKELWEQHAQ